MWKYLCKIVRTGGIQKIVCAFGDVRRRGDGYKCPKSSLHNMNERSLITSATGIYFYMIKVKKNNDKNKKNVIHTTENEFD